VNSYITGSDSGTGKRTIESNIGREGKREKERITDKEKSRRKQTEAGKETMIETICSEVQGVMFTDIHCSCD
jgi:hypothetical protein